MTLRRDRSQAGESHVHCGSGSKRRWQDVRRQAAMGQQSQAEPTIGFRRPAIGQMHLRAVARVTDLGRVATG